MILRVPTTGGAIATMARLTLTRLARGKLIWVALAIALLPIAFASSGIGSGSSNAHLIFATFEIELRVLTVMPALFVAPSIGDEIEDRTATYLWSRPLARWTIVAGKLVALAPIAMLVVVASWCAAIAIRFHAFPPAATIVGLAAGALAISVIAAAIATLAPKHGMALAIIYLTVIDSVVGLIPGSIRLATVTHATTAVSGLSAETTPLTGAIAMAIIAILWFAVAFRRIGRLET